MPDNKYEKPPRPFQLWNIGNYETVYWQERQDEYLAEITRQGTNTMNQENIK